MDKSPVIFFYLISYFSDIFHATWYHLSYTIKQYQIQVSIVLQKNPHAERQAEDELPEVDYQMEVMVNLNRSAALSPHIGPLCAEAGGATYSRHQDIQHVAAHRGQ